MNYHGQNCNYSIHKKEQSNWFSCKHYRIIKKCFISWQINNWHFKKVKTSNPLDLHTKLENNNIFPMLLHQEAVLSLQYRVATRICIINSAKCKMQSEEIPSICFIMSSLSFPQFVEWKPTGSEASGKMTVKAQALLHLLLLQVSSKC